MKIRIAAVFALGRTTYFQLWKRRGIWMWPLGLCLYLALMLVAMVFLDKVGAATREQTYMNARGVFSSFIQYIIFLSGVFTGAGFVQDDLKNKVLYPLLAKPLTFEEFAAGKFSGGMLFLASLAASLAAMFAVFDIFVLHRVAWEAWPGYAALLLGGMCALAVGMLAEQALGKWGGFAVFAMLVFTGSLKMFEQLFGKARLEFLGATARALIEAAREVVGWIMPQFGAFARVLAGAYKGETPWDSLAWLSLYSAAYAALFGLAAAWLFGKRGRFRA